MNKRKLSFKWFGSLTNLSIRRPSEKANIRQAQSMMGALAVPNQQQGNNQWMTWTTASAAPATPAPARCTHMWALCPAPRNGRRA
ncbi:Trehalose-6-phosphate synthase [Dissostichus eleginoides]|uniref:Trehalose-6-phosphate synthase n=1 Tax=Dissostichus eleginoides TaxID=100907 RepID=A0AAD9BX01_DISEL|nr:Trehalose-6-phosphate synthase [Dissostichus eleginoides]